MAAREHFDWSLTCKCGATGIAETSEPNHGGLKDVVSTLESIDDGFTVVTLEPMKVTCKACGSDKVQAKYALK